MTEFNRRYTDKAGGVRLEIMSSLESVTDTNLRIILLMMLKMSDEISSKLDSVLDDEKRIKDIVLNGQSETFSQVLSCHSTPSGHCPWAETRMKAEADLQESGRIIRNNIIEKVLVAILVFVAGATFTALTKLA